MASVLITVFQNEGVERKTAGRRGEVEEREVARGKKERKREESRGKDKEN